MRRFILGGLLPMAVCTLAHPSPEALRDEEIRKILSDRVDSQAQSVGIVVGMIYPSGRRIIAHGRRGRDDARAVDGGTVFEVGSVTKVFTALLLADMVARREAALSDAAAVDLPAAAILPARSGKTITLVDLATHTSGLPRLPDNLDPADPANPYADYSVGQLYEFLARYELTREIGAAYEYSNLGYGLLGHVLAMGAGASYESLVRARITSPLNMRSTAVALSADMRDRAAVAHDATLEPVPYWDLPTLPGAGALRSTADDLLNFLEAVLGFRHSPLAAAFAIMPDTRRPIDASDVETALGWVVSRKGGDEIIWHNGGTGGHMAFVGYRPKTRTGIVVLANAAAPAGFDDIGLHLLDAALPLAEPKRPRKVAKVDPKLFDFYVGRYQLAPDFILTVTRRDNRLFAQATGQVEAEIFPQGEKEFFYKVVDAQISFETEAGGRAFGLVLHQNGQHLSASRLD
ncbi:penicillin-binding protein [Mesorhizobium sp. L-8-3]|nr:penicillin-binding protein [Mesorhizobium sp. L-8-3]